MNCEQALILISAALDGEITPAEREQLNTHLDLCEECGALAADFGLIRTGLSVQAAVPAGLTEETEDALDAADRRKKRTLFLRRYGSVAAMLALVISLGAIALSGGGARNDAAILMFDTKMEAAPAQAAPVPSAAANAVTQEERSVSPESEAVTSALMDEVSDAGFDLYGKVTEQTANDGSASAASTGGTESPRIPETAAGEFDPPDHATIHAALRQVVEELMVADGMDAPIEEDYNYCVLGRTGDGKQDEETRLEYTGLSANGKYYTFCLAMHTVTAPDSPAQGAAYTTVFNNFAVSRELDEVLREYDENRTTEHLKAYRAALGD